MKTMILGFVFGTKAYLRKFPNFDSQTKKGLRIRQRCIQQDCCEHHFANQRQQGAGGHPTAVQANQNVNNSAYNHTSGNKVKCSSRTNVGQELEEQNGLQRPLKKRRVAGQGICKMTGKRHEAK